MRFETIVAHAQVAADAGYASLWLSDHLFLDIAKYGGTPERHGVYEPLVTLAALSRIVPDVRLGTLVLLEALRPAAVLAKALASLDRICDGRLDVGLGAGWYEPEYHALGLEMPPPGERLDRLREAVDVVTGLLGGGPLRVRRHASLARAARSTVPPALQQPRPRVFVGGKGDRLLRLVAEHADGWNTCWVWTPDEYRERVAVLDAACAAVGRDPASVWRTLGLYALCGEDDADLERRFERLQDARRRPACSTASRSSSGGGAGWSAPFRKYVSRPRSGRRSESRRSSSASGPCRSRSGHLDDVTMLGAGALPR